MPAVRKLISKNKGYNSRAVISDKVKDHGNDPFVVKKVEEAKAFLLKNGLDGLPGHSKE